MLEKSALSPEVLVSSETDPPAVLELKSKSTAVNVPRSELKRLKVKVVLVEPIVGVAVLETVAPLAPRPVNSINPARMDLREFFIGCCITSRTLLEIADPCNTTNVVFSTTRHLPLKPKKK
jgi:hypothetical protein